MCSAAVRISPYCHSASMSRAGRSPLLNNVVCRVFERHNSRSVIVTELSRMIINSDVCRELGAVKYTFINKYGFVRQHAFHPLLIMYM